MASNRPKKGYFPSERVKGQEAIELSTPVVRSPDQMQLSTGVITDTSIIEAELTAVKEERDYYRQLFRVSIGLSFVIVTLILIFTLPTIFQWSSFNNHPKKINLHIIITAVIIGLGWVIADQNKTRRTFVLGSVLLVGLFTFTQVL